MATALTLLFLLTLAFLLWGLIAPKSLAKHSRKQPTRRHFGMVFGAVAVTLLILIGATLPQAPSKPQTVQLTTAKSTQAPPKQTITEKNVAQTKAVAFTAITVQDSSLAQGTTQVTTQGVNGVETLTYQDTYTNGTQTAQKLVSDVVTTKPVTQVTSIGTYVAPAVSSAPTGCTNGTYVNSAGNTVCSPETSSTVPAGATAQCVDGTYSFSQSRSGTCSHHGGVAQWLN